MQNEVPPHPEVLPPDIKTVDTRGKEYEAFLKYVAQQSGVLSYSQLAIVWPAISQAAMEWLLTEQKSVDLGFAILHPRIHRANWVSIMLATFPRLGPTLLGKSKAVKQALLEGLGFYTKLLDASLLALGDDRYVLRGIDVELKRSWWRAAYRVEAFRLSKLGSIEYARKIARDIVKLYPKVVSTYLSYLRQTSYPCARVKGSARSGRGFLAPFVPRGRVLPKAGAEVPISIVSPRYRAEPAVPQPSGVASETACMSDLPDLQQANADMRVLQKPTTIK